jgi:hypothetical protein
MTRPSAPDPYVDAKLLGILLSGAFGQTRPECSLQGRGCLDREPSGVYRIVLPELEDDDER